MTWKFPPSPQDIFSFYFHFLPATSIYFFPLYFLSSLHVTHSDFHFHFPAALLVIHFHFHFPQAAHLVDIVHCSLLDFQLQKRLHSKARGLIKINLGSRNAVLDNQPYTWTDWECSNGHRLIKDGFKWAQIDQRWIQISPNWSHRNLMGPMCVRWVQMSPSWSKVDFRDVWCNFFCFFMLF